MTLHFLGTTIDGPATTYEQETSFSWSLPLLDHPGKLELMLTIHDASRTAGYYDISVQDLYYRFARDLIFTQGWVVLLCLEPRHEKEGLPSWVPDWSLKPNSPALYRIERFQWSFAYNAAEGFPGFPQVDLEVTGMHFDHIIWTSSIYTGVKQFSDRLDLLRDWQDLIHPEDVASRPYPAGGTRQDAFWRTMFADRYYDKEEPRIVTAADIKDLQDFVSETARDFVEFGADAVIGLNEAMTSHIIAVVERRLFVTSKGYIGLCPEASRIGDEVFVLGSCPAPVVLRSTHAEGGSAGHVSMGHCFVHGIMYGEALTMGLNHTRLYIE
ncbi:HET-domain-containing protein [Teratosphaeria destructans]|uniref:HET-domain-containing protein n=1 Tax=Teratosphaeria destructans TaxID=418781 RepID=A0A9W7VZA1_9PEZI|nr:HET-domain-containing protein [Teratosphaeria destructans]